MSSNLQEIHSPDMFEDLKSPEFSKSPYLVMATPLSQNYLVPAQDRPIEQISAEMLQHQANATMSVMALKNQLIHES